jgi:methylthioribose-1-phosphate isomerase
MPSSTIDPSLPAGDHITIEERDPRELSTLGDRRVAPEMAAVSNAAFDITPAELVTAFITDRGIVSPPYDFTKE